MGNAGGSCRLGERRRKEKVLTEVGISVLFSFPLNSSL